MLKNYNKKGQKLPLFGVGPYMVFGMGLLTLLTICIALGLFSLMQSADNNDKSAVWMGG